MFSTEERLQKKTPHNGINREEYIGLLVDEYYETTNIEAKEQVTANLANFSYDPINYKFLRKNEVINLYLELLTSPNNVLALNGISGMCNLCLDPEFNMEILSKNGLTNILPLLDHFDNQIIVNTILALYYLTSPQTKQQICSKETIKRLTEYSNSNMGNLKNIATLFLHDHCDTLEGPS